MLLHEKISKIHDLLAQVREDVADALTIQGVYREPGDFNLLEVGELIRLIKTEDFQFRFDFKAMDSVGRIRARKTGESVGGLWIHPEPAEFVVLEAIDLTEKQGVVPAIKACGINVGGMLSTASLDDPNIYIFDFKGIDSMEQQLDFIPVETEVSE